MSWKFEDPDVQYYSNPAMSAVQSHLPEQVNKSMICLLANNVKYHRYM